MLSVTTYEAAIRWWPFIGVQSSTPPFAPLRVSWDADNAQWNGDQPDADSMRAVAFNGPLEIVGANYGALAFANDGYLWAAFQQGEPAPDPGTRVGTQAGSWTLHTGQSGFIAVGGAGGFVDGGAAHSRILVIREVCW
jgi:hypothetical protein